MKTQIVKTFMTLTIFFMASCTIDDENNDLKDSSDSILGTWKSEQYFFNGKEEILSECEKKETVTFKGDGTLISTYYDKKDENCGQMIKEPGVWKKVENDYYLITINDSIFSKYDDEIQKFQIIVKSDEMTVSKTKTTNSKEVLEEKNILQRIK